MKQEPILKSVSVAITQRCNLSCGYCSRDAGKGKQDMKLKEFEYILASLRDYEKSQVEVIAISGGEPFLHPDLFYFLDLVHKESLGVTINSNLTFLPQEFLSRLKDYHVYKIVTSLDGAIPETHNNVRGQESFQRTTKNIMKLRKEKVRVNVKTVIRKENIAELEDIIKLSSSLGVEKVGFHRVCQIGRARLALDMLPLEKYFPALQSCYGIAEELGIRFAYDDPLKIFVDPELILFRDQLIGSYAGCAAGRYMINIMTDGSVLPCPAFEKPVANIFTSTIEEIFETNVDFIKLRERSTKDSYCSSCEYTTICGGCRSRALSINGDMYSDDPLCSINPNRQPLGETLLPILR